jgi:hypothetical protein
MNNCQVRIEPGINHIPTLQYVLYCIYCTCTKNTYSSGAIVSKVEVIRGRSRSSASGVLWVQYIDEANIAKPYWSGVKSKQTIPHQQCPKQLNYEDICWYRRTVPASSAGSELKKPPMLVSLKLGWPATYCTVMNIMAWKHCRWERLPKLRLDRRFADGTNKLSFSVFWCLHLFRFRCLFTKKCKETLPLFSPSTLPIDIFL